MAGNAEVGWAALLDDLIQKIGDNYLSTEDVDYYVFFRTLCGGWRRATAEPHVTPNKWIILDHSMSQDDTVSDAAVKLMNVRTGRIMEKKIHSLIRRYFHVGSSGGLIMLGQRVPPYKTRLFNPLAGAMKRLRVQIPVEQLSAVVVMMFPSLRVLVSDFHSHTIHWDDESSKEGPSYVFGEELCRVADVFGVLWSLTHFAGDLFITDRHGILSTMKGAAEECIQMAMKTTIASPGFKFPKNLFYLMKSEGELLFVVSGPVYHGEPVYRVDTKNCLLEPVRSIGSHALFVSKNRCVSSDSSTAPTVQAGSIYYADLSEIRSYDYDDVAWEKTPQVVMGYGVGWLDCSDERPFLLDQFLAEYCRTIEYSELQMVLPYGEDGTTHYDYYDACASE